MREFRYKALTAAGEMVVGIRRAPNAAMLAQELFEQDLTMLDSRPTLGSLGAAFSSAGRAGKRELRDFTLHLSTSLGAGVPVVTALRDFEDESASRAFRDIVTDLREEITSGSQVADALGKHPEVFSDVFIALVKAGQDSGNLAETFAELVNYLEWLDELRGQTKQAMVYPAILLLGVTGLFLLMMLYVIPRFTGLFADQDYELPALTANVMLAGNIMLRWWPLLASLVLGALAGWHLVRRKPRGRYLTDLALLRLPVVGGFIHKLSLARFARHFALLFSSGTDLLRLLELLQKVVGNKVLEEELIVIRNQVTTGETLASAFAGTTSFPPLIQRLVGVGEKTGQLDVTLQKAADYLDKEIPRALKQAFTVLEAIIITILGALIAISALSLLLPILHLRNQLV